MLDDVGDEQGHHIHIADCGVFHLDVNGTLREPTSRSVWLQGAGGGCDHTRHIYPPRSWMSYSNCALSGGKLYLGTAVGNLHVYNVNIASGMLLYQHMRHASLNIGVDGTPLEAELEVKKNLGRKPIEQLEYISDITSLAVLSGVCARSQFLVLQC